MAAGAGLRACCPGRPGDLRPSWALLHRRCLRWGFFPPSFLHLPSHKECGLTAPGEGSFATLSSYLTQPRGRSIIRAMCSGAAPGAASGSHPCRIGLLPSGCRLGMGPGAEQLQPWGDRACSTLRHPAAGCPRLTRRPRGRGQDTGESRGHVLQLGHVGVQEPPHRGWDALEPAAGGERARKGGREIPSWPAAPATPAPPGSPHGAAPAW